MPPGTQSAMASAQPINQPSHRGAPVSQSIQQAVSPPSKEQLKSWWRVLGRKKEKEDEKVPIPQGIFGVPLSDSILYANVAISLTDEEGESFIYGYVPIVVAKCGVFLKEKATDVEGIFRLSGSAKRIKDLQTIFNSPDRYGKGLDWTGYTVHDAANILRRYLNQLPEPIVPLDFYDQFRDPLRAYQAKAGSQHQVMENQEHAVAVHAYQALIKALPALNRQLLLYILDLLAVFASKSESNRMTAQNLAAIFQPGIISHPDHDMAPNEYRLSQDVLIFLIENQDNFLIGMNGTAMDEETKNEVKSGPPSIKTPKAAIGRSASTASAGADSLRRTGGIRRGGSNSSRNSRDRSSPGVSSPGTPASPSAFGGNTGSTTGLARSNTVPSNRSPAMAGHRFQRMSEASPATTPTAGTPVPIPGSPSDDSPMNEIEMPTTNAITEPYTPRTPGEAIANNATSQLESSISTSQETNPNANPLSIVPVNGKQHKDRKLNFFPKSPIFGPSDQQLNQQQQQQQNKPRKLQKRRIPGSANDSAQSSQASLNAEDAAVFQTPSMTPNALSRDRQDPFDTHDHVTGNILSSPTAEPAASAQFATSPPSREIRNQNRGLMPPTSPTPSIHSRGSVTDPSDLDALEDPTVREEKKRHRFRLPSAWKGEDAPLAPPPPIGQNQGARNSNSSLGSHVPRKSFTGDSQLTQTSMADTSSVGHPSTFLVSSRESAEPPHFEPTKKENVFSKWKAKLSGKGDAERAKSPPRLHPDQTTSRNSLSAMAHEAFSPRGRSMDKSREEVLPVVQERPLAEKFPPQRQALPPMQTQYPAMMQNQGSAPQPRPQEPLPMSAPVQMMSKPTQIQPQSPTQLLHSPTAPPGVAITAPTPVSINRINSDPVPPTVQEQAPVASASHDMSEPIAAVNNSNLPQPEMQETSPTNVSHIPAPLSETVFKEIPQRQSELSEQPPQNSETTSQATAPAIGPPSSHQA